MKRLNSAAPPLSIGMPVYNGANFIAVAIDSILGQTFGDFELIVSDNCSTDETPAIVREFAAKDPRVRFHRNAINQGASRNFNIAFELSRGKYFKWAAHDDFLESSYLQACIEPLEADPSISLAHSGVRRIDERGFEIELLDLREHLGDRQRTRRFRAALESHDVSAIFGVMRRETLEKIPLMRDTNSDTLLLAEVLLRGESHFDERILFNWRIHPECFRESAFKSDAERRSWWSPELKRRPLGETLRILRMGGGAILRTPLSPVETVDCIRHCLRWAARPLLRRAPRRNGPLELRRDARALR